ncbi:hypothetical protein OU995_08350 [Roseateles sp. SL47]|uniref:hypothetical protein n=1 Tax=Roseateles sp. SL47 TaxID=2995138 RepID=UPI00226F5B13|nr:hypothetical protein [Roseateles sp. SL47]WAC74696.1 hypothetical protein OU995_08350 [Roseateles sp. SL47]
MNKQIGDTFKVGSMTFYNTVAHGVWGCAEAKLNGGACSSGFRGGLAGAALSNYADLEYKKGSEGVNIAVNTAIHAVTGGLASLAGGGKFAEGAKSAAYAYLFNALGHKIIKELYDLRSGQYAGELLGHHKFDEALARKYDDYMSPDAVNAAATDRIGQGYTNTGLPSDPHAWNDAHKAAIRALDTQMDDWIASGRISKDQPMTQRQYYEFMNEASRVPAVSNFWKSIQEFVDLMQSRGIQPKLRGMPRARGLSE